MSWHRSGFLLLTTVGLASGLFWAATGPLQARLEAAQAEQAAQNAETALLHGRISDLTVMGQDGVLPDTLILAGATRAEVTADLQERLVALSRTHDVLVASFSEGAVPPGLSHPAAAVVFEGDGAQGDVIRLLAALEAQSPPVGLGQLMIRQRGAGQVSLRLLVWGLLQEEAE